ncbi:hypothetical protein MKW98_005706 [Papaver atlanticum]|uniref:PLAC8-domain-containing protein n=1 Tax=Papaver atlanticum TaxID=357466 RepID=A0AAD4S0A8_9MAGN|nr:hypothetical protein MKW98_005706 [Papaver atlanticum]
MSYSTPPPQPSYAQEQPIANGVPVDDSQFQKTPMSIQMQPRPRPQPQPLVPWSTGLCGCFDDISNCCLTCWCPCITFGLTSEIIDRGSSGKKTYNLEGNNCTDCLSHCCCPLCALSQEYRELKNRGFDVSLGWHGNMGRGRGDVALTPPAAYGGGMER